MKLAGESTLLRGARALGQWWLAEIREMLPEGMRPSNGGIRGRELRIAVAPGRLVVTLRRGRKSRALGEVALERAAPGVAGQQLADIVRRRFGSYDSISLAVPPERALTRRTRLPYAARANLDEALGYDMDRQTPFAEEDVYYGAVLRETDREAGWIEAELDVVHRADVEPALAALTAANLTPDRLIVDGLSSSGGSAAGRANMLPQDLRPAPRPLLRRATMAMAAACLLLGATAAYLPLYHLNQELSVTQRHLDAARRAAAEVEALRSKRELLTQREAELRRRKADEPGALEILAQITNALPDSTFVVDFRYEGDSVTLTGYAPRASALIGQLEGVPALRDARFRSPVTQDGQGPGERFNVAAKVNRNRDGVQEAAR